LIKIGSQKIDTNIFLAPLAGCADLSFRLVARELGARFCFYEMVDSNALLYQKEPRRDILKTHPKDHPIAAQLLGSEPERMLEAAKRLLSLVTPEFLDINAACPAKKVLKKRCGAYFLKEPSNLYKIIEKLSANLTLPITVKLRIGYNLFDPDHIISIAKNCQKSGAAALFVHGRTMKQRYSGKVNYEAIKAVKDNTTIPVFGSGDILSQELAQKMFDQTGCDGILVARGAMGNPWFFCNKKPSIKERLDTLNRHLSYLEKYKETRATAKLGLMKKAVMWYLKEFANAHEFRNRINGCKSIEEIRACVSKII